MAFDRLKLAALATVCWANSCADLPEIERLVCGNSLVEPEVGEACDTFATGTGDDGLPTRCGKPGTDGACLFIHDDEHDCPPGYGAGIDGICRRPLGTFGAEKSRIEASGTILRVADFDGDGVDDLMTTTPLASVARVQLFSAGGGLRESRAIPTSETYFTPAIGELSGEAGPGQAADVVIANTRGLAVYQGSASGFRTKAYAETYFPEAATPLAVPALALLTSLDDATGPVAFTNVTGFLTNDAGDVEMRLLDSSLPVGRIPNATLEGLVGFTKTNLLPTPGFLLFPYDDFAFAVRSETGPDKVVFVNPHVDPTFRTTITACSSRPKRRPDRSSSPDRSPGS